MARRPSQRATLKFDRLESREVLSSGGPTGEVQAMIELVNLARQNPTQAAEWAGSDLKTDSLGLTLKTFKVDLNQARNDIRSKAKVQPLAWNDSLGAAALTQSRSMAERGVQTHDGGGTLADGTVVGVTGDDRISNAGYTGRTISGENAFAYATSVDNAMQAFLIDWGNDPAVKPHLANIVRPEYREIGIGVVNTKGRGVGPKVITQNFAARAGAKAMLLGVAYNDSVKADHFYQAGEGVGDVAIDVANAKGQTQTASTWDAGGYQVALEPGTYAVTARVGNRVIRRTNVTIGTENVKVDFNLADAWDNATIAPAPAPIVEAPPAPAPVVVKVLPLPVVIVAPVVAPPAVVVIAQTPALPVVSTPAVTVETPVVKVQTSAPKVEAPAVVVTVKSAPIELTTATKTELLSAFSAIQWESW